MEKPEVKFNTQISDTNKADIVLFNPYSSVKLTKIKISIASEIMGASHPLCFRRFTVPFKISRTMLILLRTYGFNFRGTLIYTFARFVFTFSRTYYTLTKNDRVESYG